MKLKKLAVLIEETKYLRQAQELVRSLNKEGLPARQYSVTEYTAGQEIVQEPDALYLTDSKEVCRKVDLRGGCTVVFLHEKNREEDFGGVKYAMENITDLEALYFERVYLRLTGQPWEILKTKRCILRETVEEDVDAFCRIYSDPAVTKYTEPLYEDKEKEKQYIRDYRKYCYGFYEFGIWTILEKETGQIIGRAGINLREGFDTAEMGFMIGTAWQRRGYAYEVCSGVVDYARTQLGMEALQALVLPENKASIKLCEKLGFVHRGETVLAERAYRYYFLRMI